MLLAKYTRFLVGRIIPGVVSLRGHVALFPANETLID